MTPARAEILARVRHALGGSRPATAAACEAEYERCARDYVVASRLSEGQLVELFASRIVHYDGSISRCREVEVQAAIAAVLSARDKRRIVVPPDIDVRWLPPAITCVPDIESSAEELDRCQGVMTGCAVAIATTGTVVLTHESGQGRRVLTLVPDYHLSIVFADQIVETVPEGLRRIAAMGPRLITTISGPSATADIEMTRIKGVHGPRTLDVILVTRDRGGLATAAS
jgi:L-lactate dehydrogenase complex protein LldG